jgi:hypothetical protein
MSHEINQLDIPDRQLQASTSQSKASTWTDIGEAQITYTIFGKAKVRIIRKHDNARRTFLLTGTAVMVLAALAWQVWFTSQQTEPQQSADPASTLSASELESAPSPTELNQHSVPQQLTDLNGTGQLSEKPVTARPLIASKPQTAPHAANDSTSTNQTGMQQPVASTVATPPATRPVPLLKEGTSPPSPTGDNQAAVSAQP